MTVKMTRCNPWIGCLLVATAGLVGCSPKTSVSTTANVPAAYSHAYMSVQEIWFNTDASATPDDTTWKKFPLTTPVTVDLSTSLDGTLTPLTAGLAVPVGTYAQIRLIPVDASATLLSSASGLGAVYNSEVDYVDSSGATHQLPLELLNPDKGVGVTTTIQVKGDTSDVFSSAAASASTSTTDNSTSTDTSTGLDNISTTDISATATTATTPTTTTTNTSTGVTPAATFKLAINVDGSKDLVPFTYSDVAGILLNPHITAYDQAAAGAISGTLDVSSLTGLTSASSSYLNIQVTAESLSADGTRHIAVNSAPVNSGGTFTIYPLSSTSSSATSYDLVIHGPGIATIIVKGVTVNVGDPSSVSPVNIGTITPRAASTFKVNLNATNPLPAGALVGFYQTLPGSSEVPYLVDSQPIDPFTRLFNADVAESLGTIDYGTYASGATVNLSSSDPTEGTATYRVAGSAPLFADGALTTTVAGTSGGAATAIPVAVPTLAAASGATLDSTTVTIGKSSSTKYNKGELIFSHDGAIVQTVALDSVLTQSANATLTISGLPGGGSTGTFADGLYYVSVRVWNTSNAAGTVNREIYPTPLDLRSGSLSGYQLNIN
jgi:trimeric autotransporter adhesin